MKKRKLTLALALSLAAVTGITACSSVTAKDGVLLTYKDASGKSHDYTAQQLLDDYDQTSSAASTDFDKFKEVLIRKYYQSDANKTKLEELKRKARNAVDSLKKQAQDAAGGDASQYLKEMEKIYSNNNVKNIDELYDLKLYEEEKSDFDSYYKSKNNKEFMRDGVDEDGKKFFNSSATFDPEGFKGYDGYLNDRMPYHVSHILIKTDSAKTGNFTEDKISSTEATNLADVVKALAGATGEKGKTTAAVRTSFEDIAHTYSQDEGSKANYGELTDKDNTPMDTATSYVPEFKLGLYAYETMFNKHNQAENSYATEKRKANLLPTKDAKYETSEGEKSVKDFVSGMEIGQIPYGVFAALGDYDTIDGKKQKVADDPEFTYELKNNSATYYARNVLFNKYLNKHQIAVIVPNRVPYNDYLDNSNSVFTFDDEVDTNGQMKTVGKADANYAALPGFAYNTKEILPGIGQNVLTTEKGQIVLVARVDSDGYHGIHFIVINRSSLEQYGSTVVAPTYNEDGTLKTEGTITLNKNVTAEERATKDITSLSEYYAFTEPSEKEFKENLRYTDAEGNVHDKTTYVNAILHEDRATYASKYSKLEDAIGSYNPNLDTYMFQHLIEANGIDFVSADDNASVKKAKELIVSWIKNARNKSVTDASDSLDDAWTSYVEMLIQQDAARKIGKTPTDKWRKDSKLISETCAIGFKSEANMKDGSTGTEWDVGGLCYHVN